MFFEMIPIFVCENCGYKTEAFKWEREEISEIEKPNSELIAYQPFKIRFEPSRCPNYKEIVEGVRYEKAISIFIGKNKKVRKVIAFRNIRFCLKN